MDRKEPKKASKPDRPGRHQTRRTANITQDEVQSCNNSARPCTDALEPSLEPEECEFLAPQNAGLQQSTAGNKLAAHGRFGAGLASIFGRCKQPYSAVHTSDEEVPLSCAGVPADDIEDAAVHFFPQRSRTPCTNEDSILDLSESSSKTNQRSLRKLATGAICILVPIMVVALFRMLATSAAEMSRAVNEVKRPTTISTHAMLVSSSPPPATHGDLHHSSGSKVQPGQQLHLPSSSPLPVLRASPSRRVKSPPPQVPNAPPPSSAPYAPNLPKHPPPPCPSWPPQPPVSPPPPAPPLSPLLLCLNSTHGAQDDAAIESCDQAWCSVLEQFSVAEDLCSWCKCRTCAPCLAPVIGRIQHPPPPPVPAPNFISSFDIYLFRGGAFTFMMANMWYAAWLGSDSSSGDRRRLRRELDRLKAMGVASVRILAGSEGCMEDSPMCQWSMTPPMQVAPGQYDHSVLVGLDLVMFELEARGMVAVLVLTSMWPDSGGMAQYVEWAGGEAAPAPQAAELQDVISWNRLRFFTKASRFFEMPEAIRLSHNHIRFLLGRRNSFTGRRYSDDPTVMSWEMANAPRPMGKIKAYRAWIASTARLLKKLAPNHLVAIGSEGAHAAQAEEWSGRTKPTDGWEPDVSDFAADHSIEGVDYATCQLWIEPWGWYDHSTGDSGMAAAIDRAKLYLQAHMKAAVRMGKPLVVDEVGLSRDNGKYAKTAGVSRRNMLLTAIFDLTHESVANRGELAGVGFAGWSGEARPVWRAVSTGPVWHPGDPLLADSTTSHQGLNSIYDADKSTVELIHKYGHRWANQGNHVVHDKHTSDKI